VKPRHGGGPVPLRAVMSGKSVRMMGRDSVVGVTTRYGLDSPEIKSRWAARFSAHVQTGYRAKQASCTIGVGLFQGVMRPERGVNHPPHLAPRLKKE
jgi:hypothetical protein